MSNHLENKVAIITRSTSGISWAIASLFAKKGAKVILAGHRENLGENLAEAI